MANRTKGNTNQKLDKLNKLNVLWKKSQEG